MKTRKPKSKKITAIVYGVMGIGETKTAARENAIEQMGQMIDGSYTPMVIHAPHFYAVIFRDPFCGWSYAICENGKDYTAPGFSAGHSDKYAAERTARRHLGQTELDYIVNQPQGAFVCALSDLIASVVQPQTEQDEYLFAHWANWQHRYAAWRAPGISHEYARIGADTGQYPRADMTIEEIHKSFAPLAQQGEQ